MTRASSSPEGIDIHNGPWAKCPLLKDDGFRVWLQACLDTPKVQDQLVDFDWSTVKTPLDVECFLAGGAWSLFYRDKEIKKGYEALLLPSKPPKVDWWSKKVWKYDMTVWFFPSAIVRERHLEAFIRGVAWRKKTHGLPTKSLQDFLQLMIGLSDKAPSPEFAREFTTLFPDDRVEDRILVLAGHRSYLAKERKNLAGYPPRGLLGSPWICKADLKEATAQMPVGVLYGPMISVLSSEVLARKLLALPRSKGNSAWAQRARLGLPVVDSDKDLLPLLPAITPPDWLGLVRDLIARKTLFDKERRKAASSLRDAACVSLA